MERIEKLEARIKYLEYRLSVVERFLDRGEMLFHKQDESLMNGIKIEMMKRHDIAVDTHHDSLGTSLFNEATTV